LRDGASTTSDELLEFCRQELAKYKVPAKIDILDEIPKTTVGKIDKSAVRELLKALA